MHKISEPINIYNRKKVRSLDKFNEVIFCNNRQRPSIVFSLKGYGVYLYLTTCYPANALQLFQNFRILSKLKENWGTQL